MVFVVQRHASVASHAMSEVDTQTFTHSTGVTVRAVEDWAITVIIKIANVAKVFCKSPFMEIAADVYACFGSRLQDVAFHA
mmetsp:Transcript_25979/g.57238  ORF Transcript_25979/g.57238 Transcript_25979/m.57238 type:complete len:81 (+) Transcript_25979:477-719(+)